MHFDEYRMWALKNPQALAFFASLPQTLKRLINSEGQSQSGAAGASSSEGQILHARSRPYLAPDA